jgi:hypothetical protein
MKRYIVPAIYITVLVVTLTSLGLVVGAWAFRHVDQGGKRLPEPLSELVTDIAQIPSLVRSAFLRLGGGVFGGDHPLLIEQGSGEASPSTQHFPEPADQGYILLSGLDENLLVSNVRLLKIATGKEVLRWDIDWHTIFDLTQDSRFSPRGDPRSLRAIHPILMDDASIIFNTGSVLVRQSACKVKPDWILNGVFHHSNELALDGSIWTPSVNTDLIAGYEHPLLLEKFRDDALANVSQDGKLLRRISFASILRANGLEHLMFGFNGQKFQEDPIHINQISPALNDSSFWKRGDLLISARHLSTVFLYRPDTNKIIWYRTGPWMNQHAAKFVGDRQISVFDNNVFSGSNRIPPFLNDTATNRVFVVDLVTNELSQPFEQALKNARVRTITEGRAQIVSNNRLFIEETNYGRHLMLSDGSTIWSRLNQVTGSEKRGAVSWSRYIEANEGKRFEDSALTACASNNSIKNKLK